MSVKLKPARAKARFHVFVTKDETRYRHLLVNLALGGVCYCIEMDAYFVMNGKFPFGLTNSMRPSQAGWKAHSLFINETEETRDSFDFYSDVMLHPQVKDVKLRVGPTNPCIARVLEITEPVYGARRVAEFKYMFAQFAWLSFSFANAKLVHVFARLSRALPRYEESKAAYDINVKLATQTPTGKASEALSLICDKYRDLIVPRVCFLLHATMKKKVTYSGFKNLNPLNDMDALETMARFLAEMVNNIDKSFVFKHLYPSPADGKCVFLCFEGAVDEYHSIMSSLRLLCPKISCLNMESLQILPPRELHVDRTFKTIYPDELSFRVKDFDAGINKPSYPIDNSNARALYHHNLIVDNVIALCFFGMAVYPTMWLLDWLPYLSYYPDLWKVRLIENVYNSISRVRAARETKQHRKPK
jgi:hypothetical protein